MQKKNYQLILDQMLNSLKESSRVPTLLLQCCCAPCSSYVLEYLSSYFRITAFYYNPNISPESEYRLREEELKRMVSQMKTVYSVTVQEGHYEPELFYQITKGMENQPEGSQRCLACYELRLQKTAELAREGAYDFFTTTLSISPLKNADRLNEIGEKLSIEYGVPYLFSDFKKKGGYKRSVELSAVYGLYRQDYCGCIFSRLERERQKECKNGQKETGLSMKSLEK